MDVLFAKFKPTFISYSEKLHYFIFLHVSSLVSSTSVTFDEKNKEEFKSVEKCVQIVLLPGMEKDLDEKFKKIMRYKQVYKNIYVDP